MSNHATKIDSARRLLVPPVKPRQRSRIVAEQLLAAIRQQGIQAGDKLPPERELAKAMNISRNTLREAIAALQLLGFFEVRRSSGIYLIKQPHDMEMLGAVDNLYETDINPFMAIDARIAMEPGAAMLASRTADPIEWQTLGRTVDDMGAAIRDGNYPHYSHLGTVFHQVIARATHNELLINSLLPIINSMDQPLWRTMKANIHTPEIRGASLAEHRLILEAMRMKDDYMIFRAMSTHLTNSKNRFDEKMVEEESGDQN